MADIVNAVKSNLNIFESVVTSVSNDIVDGLNITSRDALLSINSLVEKSESVVIGDNTQNSFLNCFGGLVEETIALNDSISNAKDNARELVFDNIVLNDFVYGNESEVYDKSESVSFSDNVGINIDRQIIVNVLGGVFYGRVPITIQILDGAVKTYDFVFKYWKNGCWKNANVLGCDGVVVGIGVNALNFYWNADKDLKNNISTRLIVSLSTGRVLYESGFFSVIINAPQIHIPFFVANNGVLPIVGNSLPIKITAINPYGYNVHSICSRYGQYVGNVKKTDILRQSNLTFENTVINNGVLKLIGDGKEGVNSEKLVKDGLVFGLHGDSHKDWVGYRLVNKACQHCDFYYEDENQFENNFDVVANGGAYLTIANSDMIKAFDHLPIKTNNEYAYSLWFKYGLATSGSDYWTLVSYIDGSKPIVIRRSDTELGYYSSKTSEFGSTRFKFNSLSVGWHHLVVNVSLGKTMYYIDNNLVGSVALGDSGYISALGNIAAGSQQFGIFGEFRLYDHLLSADEIHDLRYGELYNYSGRCYGTYDIGQDVNLKTITVNKKELLDSNVNVNCKILLESDVNVGFDNIEPIVVGENLKNIGRARYLWWEAIFNPSVNTQKTPLITSLLLESEDVAYEHTGDFVNYNTNSIAYNNFIEWQDCVVSNVEYDFVNNGMVSTVNNGTIGRVVDFGTDIDFGVFEFHVDGFDENNYLNFSFRSCLDSEGLDDLTLKSFVLAGTTKDGLSVHVISGNIGRYLEWKIEFVYSSVSPVLNRFVLWKHNNKFIYPLHRLFGDCVLDNVVETDSGFDFKNNEQSVVLTSDSVTGYVSSGIVTDVVDFGLDVDLSYVLVDSYNPIVNSFGLEFIEGVNYDCAVKTYFRCCTSVEGQESLSLKDWVLLTNSDDVYGLSCRWLEWKCELTTNHFQGTPELRRIIIGIGENDVREYSVDITNNLNLGALNAKAIAESSVNSRFTAIEGFRENFVLDDVIPDMSRAPFLRWDNVTHDVSKDVTYLIQFNEVDNLRNANNVVRFVKNSDSGFDGYVEKTDSVTVGGEFLTIDGDYGNIVYRLELTANTIWKNFNFVDNAGIGEKGFYIEYFARFSLDGTTWTEYNRVSSGNLLKKYCFVELKIVFVKKHGTIFPVVYSLAVDCFDGTNMYIVNEGDDGYTEYDVAEVGVLEPLTYYCVRVLAFDGVNHSRWSRAQVYKTLEEIPVPEPKNLMVDGKVDNIRVIDLTPLFSWEFNQYEREQQAFRLQVGESVSNWNVWDTGRVDSAVKSVEYGVVVPNVVLESKELLRGVNYSWRVMVWNDLNMNSAYSENSGFMLNIPPDSPETLSPND